PHARRIADADLLPGGRPGAAAFDRRRPHHGVRLRSRRLYPAPGARPPGALDAFRADHGPGDIPVEPALRLGHGDFPDARRPGAGRADADARQQEAGRRPMNRLLRNLFMGVVLAALLAPLVVLGGVSLNERKELLFPPRGFSL